MQQERVLYERPREDGVALAEVHGQLGDFNRRIAQRISYALEVCFTARFKDADVLALRQTLASILRGLCVTTMRNRSYFRPSAAMRTMCS